MTKIAYKVNTTNPNLPSNFIIDHFETDQDELEGYLVVERDVFQQLISNNVPALRQHEALQAAATVAPNPSATVLRPASDAQPVDQALMEQKKKEYEEAVKKQQEEIALFQQFMAWKKAQESNG